MMKIKKYITEKIQYLIRPELNIQRKMSNIIILSALIVMAPVVIASIILGTVTTGIYSELLMFAIIAFFLWYSNKKDRGQLLLAEILFLINSVAFPIMFFMCGGRRSGMPLWMFLGALFSLLLLNGVYRVVLYILDVITFAICLLFEMHFPNEIEVLANESDQVLDIIIAFAFVLLILGAVNALQTKLYEKQRKELEAKEEELRKLNEELQRASQAKSDFLANMSHEIRTPINAIMGMDEMVIRDAKDPLVLGYARDIESASKQLLSLVNDILDFSKIQSGKFALTYEDYDLYSLINDCYKMEIGRANEKHLKFEVVNNPDIPARLIGDEIRIKQIIINFLTNAIKYTEQGSVTLKFDMEKVDDENVNLFISVTDTGIGIEEENLKKLFNMFTRVDEDLHRNIEGTGLGLAISKQLAELMNGKINVESCTGKGSTFMVTIPQQIKDSTPMGVYGTKQLTKDNSKSARKQTFIAENASILVVDDVRVNLNVVKLLLRDTKMQMDLAESGAEAIEYIRRKHYDIVLMDHMMPDMDGIETLQKIRKMKSNENCYVPIIALTANAVQGADKMYLEAGFCDYLTKPVRAPELEAAIIKHLPDGLVTLKA